MNVEHPPTQPFSVRLILNWIEFQYWGLKKERKTISSKLKL